MPAVRVSSRSRGTYPDQWARRVSCRWRYAHHSGPGQQRAAQDQAGWDIDAPEKRQTFGERSSQHLAHLAHGRDSTAQCHKIDRYRRKVCKVMVQPPDCPTCDKTLDVGVAQLTVGAAWSYREYSKEQSPEDRGRYEVAEQEARGKRQGLWVDKNPVPPWEWRGLYRVSVQAP